MVKKAAFPPVVETETPTAVAIEETLKTEALTLSQRATSITVSNADEYKSAIEFGKGITELRKKVVDYFAPLKEAAHRAHRLVCAKESEELEPIAKAETLVKSKVSAYRAEEDRKAREVARAEEDRLRAIAEEERQRAVEAAKAEGNKKEAKTIAAQPLAVPIVRVESAVPKVAGTTKRVVFSFQIIDANKVPRQFLCVDESAVRAFVNAKKEAGEVIPGVLVTREEKTSW